MGLMLRDSEGWGRKDASMTLLASDLGQGLCCPAALGL